MAISVFVALLTAVVVQADTTAPPCKRFDAIYASGKELCENMWGGAFKYEVDEAKAYTMWFFDKQNPNDATARSLGKLSAGEDHAKCHLDYYHKEVPGPEPDGFTECHPWKDAACCAHSTVETGTKLKEGYGKGYEWDRCGPISQECERFFVQEACFYECDPNAGLYRKWHQAIYDPRCDKYSAGYDEAHTNKTGCDHNAWQMADMPIKASYCDAWWLACRKDLFCAAAGGDYFSCANIYEAMDKSAALNAKIQAEESENAQLRKQLLEKDDEEDGIGGLGLPVIIVLGVLLLFFCGASGFLISREKNGKPVFGKLLETQQSGPPGEAIGGRQ